MTSEALEGTETVLLLLSILNVFVTIPRDLSIFPPAILDSPV